MRLFFVSKNPFKQAEACDILGPLGVIVEADHSEIHELQTADTEALVKDKAAKHLASWAGPYSSSTLACTWTCSTDCLVD